MIINKYVTIGTLSGTIDAIETIVAIGCEVSGANGCVPLATMVIVIGDHWIIYDGSIGTT